MPEPRRVASLLRRLINLGKELVVAVRLRHMVPACPSLAKAFGTTDVYAILARIGRAMSHAAVLEDILLKHDNTGPQAMAAAARAPRRRSSAQAEPHGPPEKRPSPRPVRQREAARQDALPSLAQLRAEIRRRPVADMLIELCREFGITTAHPLWPEMAAAITAYGGSTAALEGDDPPQWDSRHWLDLPYPRQLMDLPSETWPALLRLFPLNGGRGPP